MANTAISKYPLAKVKFAQMEKMEKHVFFALIFHTPYPISLPKQMVMVYSFSQKLLSIILQYTNSPF